MRAHSAAAAMALCVAAACAHGGSAPTTPAPPPTDARIVGDFERAVLAGEDAYAALFDFAAVGEFEKLLHRYDLLGRAELTDDQRKQFSAEDATPFSVARERHNLGSYFYPTLAKRTVGTGGCTPAAPVDEYARRLGQPFEPLPAELASYEALRTSVNARIARGGIVGLTCKGGEGGLAVVWTRADNARGYDLITMYDDLGLGAAP